MLPEHEPPEQPRGFPGTGSLLILHWEHLLRPGACYNTSLWSRGTWNSQTLIKKKVYPQHRFPTLAAGAPDQTPSFPMPLETPLRGSAQTTCFLLLRFIPQSLTVHRGNVEGNISSALVFQAPCSFCTSSGGNHNCLQQDPLSC